MNGRVLQFDDPVHLKVEELLPWFLNGTLEPEELALADNHLKDCVRCQRELLSLRELRTAYVASEVTPDPGQSFNRLRPRLAEPRLWQPLASLAARLPGFWRSTPSWPRWAIAAQLCMILAAGALLAPGTERSSLYRTLGASDVAQASNGSLVVVFDPMITEGELRRILLSVGARVVDGPTKSGGYILWLPPQREAEALKALRAEHLVTLAERLGPGTNP